MSEHPLGIDLNDFPIREHVTYLNHAGTSPITRPAANMMKLFADEVSQYASAIYEEWTKRQNATRQRTARILGCSVEEVAFTTSTTAGLNLVALGIDWQPGDVIVAEERTFPANWLAWKKIAEQRGAAVWPWRERNYRYELEDLEERLKQGGVRMVAATSANFGTGFRQDMEAIGKLCKEYNALFCVDAIQTLGAFPMDVKRCHIDFLSADSHKWLLGPEGSAIFYCAKDKLDCLDESLIGWMGREGFTQFERLDLPPDPTARRFEEGAPNIAGILAMGESFRVLLETGIDKISAHNLALCRVLRQGLEDLGWTVVAPAEEKHAASIVPAWKEGVNPAEVVPQLWKKHDIWAAARRDFLRLSPHFYQTEDDMHRVLRAVADVQKGN